MTLALVIDPGTAICGFGLVDARNSRLRPVRFGAITTDKQLPAQERLAVIYEGLTEIIAKYNPDMMAVEQLFFNRNVTTAMTVGQSRGVILLAAAHRKLKVAEYTPLQIKQAVTGYGNATKEQVIFMIQRLLLIKEKIKPDDAADALAAAICALHSIGGG